MELDELKNIYSALDKRFERNNSFNEKIYTEMTKNKGKKSTNRLLSFELIGAVVCILLMPPIVFHFSKYHGWYPAFDVAVIFVMILLTIVSIWQIYKTYVLMKVDFQNSISNNIYHINRYNILIKREKLTTFIFLPFFFVSFVALGTHLKIVPWKWALFAGTFISTILISYWLYKRFYNDNVNSIIESLNNLNELKELEDEKKE